MSSSLAAVFQRHASHPGAREWPLRDLEQRLQEIHGACQGMWPDLAVPVDGFVRHLAENLPDGRDFAECLARLQVTDLYLACGCMLGLPAALEGFDRKILTPIAPMLYKMGLPAAQIDELLQILRTRLLVLDEGQTRPMIASYAGRGPLLGWVRTTARRTAVDMRRKKDDRLAGTGEPDNLALLLAPHDLKLDYLKNRYQGEFRQAVSDAIRKLDPERMKVLRLHYIDGLSIDRIGEIMQVHRATAARWINAAEEAVSAETRRLLRARLGLHDSEIDGLAALVKSQLHLSISRLLSK